MVRLPTPQRVPESFFVFIVFIFVTIVNNINSGFHTDAETFFPALAPSQAYSSCGNALYSYGDTSCSTISSDKTCNSEASCDGIFCEFSPKCTAMDFSEMNIKGESQMSFLTIVKDYHKTTGGCGDNYDNNEINSAYCTANGYKFFQNPGTGYCSCVKMQNLYPQAVEKLSLNVMHSYMVSGIPYPETENKKRVNTYGTKEHNRFKIPTYICEGHFSQTNNICKANISLISDPIVCLHLTPPFAQSLWRSNCWLLRETQKQAK